MQTGGGTDPSLPLDSEKGFTGITGPQLCVTAPKSLVAQSF